jgi:hypothetical protein
VNPRSAIIIYIASIMLLLPACRQTRQKGITLFRALDAKRTGLNFSNKLTPSPDLNMLKYMYFYNGAGVGAGDFNNDGLVDLFFASNQEQNKIYLNSGDLSFKDVTKEALIPDDKGWSTGVSVVDINNDGLLDIYVCRVGNYEHLKSRNQLLVCQRINDKGVPEYKDEAASYGLDFSGFGTHAAFLDYDLDGDLDMFLLNHSLRYNSTFAPRSSYSNTSDSLSKDCVFRNDGTLFTDVSKEAGINQSIVGYGLGIVVSDINLDGYPDIYIGNDFHENDYLYINNRKGGFTEETEESMMHTSQFSMGVDAADINNDAWPDLVAADMLPSDPYILRRSLGEDEYNTFQIKIRNGYNYQYARNTLQLNRSNGLFSEVGLYSGIYATDWSWATLWLDFDNDGMKDLFISNGIPKRLNDIDYVNYVSGDEIQAKIRANQLAEKDMTLIDKFPQIKLRNRFFRNKGNALFEDAGNEIKDNPDTYSNGALYADFDNDGDLDIVVNNIDETVVLYQNTVNDEKKQPAVQLVLEGPEKNKKAIGAKLFIFSGDETRSYEKYPVHGFQSSMEIPLTVAPGSARIDSALLIWPDNSCQAINLTGDSSLQLVYKKGLPAFDYDSFRKKKEKDLLFADITAHTGLRYRHTENSFNEFDREPLLPFMSSQEGPALTTDDINNDGLADIFIGSSKWEKSAVFIQKPGGSFVQSPQEALIADSTYEDVAACWVDVNNDGYKDLVIASGGNEYYGKSEYLSPRVYLNSKEGKLVRKKDAFTDILMTASTVTTSDLNQDGFADLFIGGRAVPWEYGKVPTSYLFLNDGTGKFSDVTDQFAPGCRNVGFVKHSVWTDIDNDNDMDLVLSLEWDGICVFANDKGRFTKKYITDKKGWWNFTLPIDVDNDGDLDLIAGNQGLNSRLKATQEEPVRLYYYDFDGNGKKEQIITYYLEGKEFPFANKGDLERQMPFLKKKYLYAEAFAKASPKEVFGADKLAKADLLTADFFENSILINEGNFRFTVKTLSWQAQLTSYRDAAVTDINKDGFPDILLAGNFYANNIQMGRYDADFGTLLVNNGKGEFFASGLSGIQITGEMRHIIPIRLDQRGNAFVIARNNDSLLIIHQK